MQRSVAYVVRSPRTAIERVRQRTWACGLVGQSQPAAGQRPHLAGDLRRVAGADLVHAGDARHRRRDGAAARRGRDLRRDLLLGVAADARDRHPHRARRARAGGHAACSSSTGSRWPAIGVAIGLAAAIGVMRLIASLLFEVNPVDPLTYGAGLIHADRAPPCSPATCRRCAPPPSIRSTHSDRSSAAAGSWAATDQNSRQGSLTDQTGERRRETPV